MPTGSRSPQAPGRRAAGRGFSYLLLLFMVALAGTALAAVGSQWQQQAQRQREQELQFRGLQLRDALLHYAAATPPGQPALPTSLAALLSDDRSTPPRHHLRQLWPDPFTGQPDWVLLRDATGRIAGLHSAAQRVALHRHALPAGISVANDGRRVADWQFIAAGAATAAAAPAAPADAPGHNPHPDAAQPGSADPTARSSQP